MIKELFGLVVSIFLYANSSFASTLGFEHQGNFFESITMFFVLMLVFLFLTMTLVLYKKGVKVFAKRDANFILWIVQLVFLRVVTKVLLVDEPKYMARGNDFFENFELFLRVSSNSRFLVYSIFLGINILIWSIYIFHMLRTAKKKEVI